MQHILGIVLYNKGLIGEPFYYSTDMSDPRSYLGSVIRVPFAKEVARGVVVSCSVTEGESTQSYTHLSSIEVLYDAMLSPTQCALLVFMASRYRSPIHKVLRLFIPEKIWNGSFTPTKKIYLSLGDPEAYTLSPRMKAMIRVEQLLKSGMNTKEEILKEVTRASYAKAVSLGVVIEREGEILPLYTAKGTVRPEVLTEEQYAIYTKIVNDRTSPHLIHGVTGAGKTEIYLHLALEAAKQGKQSLIVVPEIVLTPQLRSYFAEVFGERVSIFHSKLSEGERLQEWWRVRSGESVVILGSRSAFFAPFHDLGLIVIDEEHEWTYKNEQNPRYYLHTLALRVHELEHKNNRTFSLVFGSATPRVETYARIFAKHNPIHLSRLDKKIFEQTPR